MQLMTMTLLIGRSQSTCTRVNSTTEWFGCKNLACQSQAMVFKVVRAASAHVLYNLVTVCEWLVK
jgi:hypothetical protein